MQWVQKGAKWALLGIYVCVSPYFNSPPWVIYILDCAVLVIFKVILAGHIKETSLPDCIKNCLHVLRRKGLFFPGLSNICEVYEIKVFLLLENTISKLCMRVSIMRWYFSICVWYWLITGPRNFLYHLKVRGLELKIKDCLPLSTQLGTSGGCYGYKSILLNISYSFWPLGVYNIFWINDLVSALSH